VIAALVVLAALSPRPVHAEAVVGTGTASSCTEAALDTALAAGGRVTFNCGASPVAIGVTSQKILAGDTIIDGGGLVTLMGSGATQVGALNGDGPPLLQGLASLRVVVNPDATLALANMTISNSSTSDYDGGGAVLNGGTLTVTNCTFATNSAGYSGGGAISNSGNLTVTNSTFSGNYADHGGAIYNSGTLTVSNSTFSYNSVIFSGAMPTLGGGGGAISNSGNLIVLNSTFSDNVAQYGGAAISNEYLGSSSLSNTIVANSNSVGNCSGTITDGGHNVDDGTTCGFRSPTGSLSNANALLDPAGLANNGGPTQTIALQAGSPAIDSGNEAVCSAPPVNNLDQRGYPRPGTGAVNCSIGAYEYSFQGSTPCAGDCDGNHQVTVDEILAMVNIALGNAHVTTCEAGDANHDNQITIDEILAAVNNALGGCREP